MSSKRVFGNSYNKSGRMRSKVVSNDEFVGAIVGSVAFANIAFACNPGQAILFPWLSVESTQWEKYVFEMLEFYYEHEVSEFATNGTTGKIILAFDYDAADPPPTTKSQVENTEPHIDAMPCEDILLKCNPRDLSGNTDLHYVRKGNVPGGADIRLYDVGILNVATQGNQNTSEIGELHVRYRCRFEVPILESTNSAPVNNQVSQFASTAPQTITRAVPAVQVVATVNTNGLTAVNTAGSIVLPAGNYLVSASTLFQVSGGDLSQDTTYGFAKNATAFGTQFSQTYGGAADLTATFVLPPQFYTSNGTDALTLVLAATFTGTATATTVITIVAA